MASGFSLWIIEYEHEYEEVGEWLNVGAAVAVAEFKGQSGFWLRRREFDEFIGDLQHFADNLKAPPSLRAGWGEHLLFDFTAKPVGGLGAILVDVTLAAESPPPELRLRVQFGSEPQLLADFAASLRRAVESKSTKPVRLATLRAPNGKPGGRSAGLWGGRGGG